MSSQADLIVGNRMPRCFSDFGVHTAANKLLFSRWTSEGFDASDCEQHKAGFPHPGFALREYIRASFEVLKEAQEQILNRELDDITERELDKRINIRIKRMRTAREERLNHASEALDKKALPSEVNGTANFQVRQVREKDRASI
jgi:hypothetical protein